MAIQVPSVLLVIKGKWEWKVNKDVKEILVLLDQEVMLEIKGQGEEEAKQVITHTDVAYITIATT